MTADPLRDLFGTAPNSDPLADVFGTAPNEDFARGNPLEPHDSGLGRALRGGAEAQHHFNLADEVKSATAPPPKAPVDTTDVPAYLGHGLESGIYSVGAGLGDVAEGFNPVSAARDAWLTIRDAAHQAMSGSLVGDRNAYMRSQAAKDASTPFTRFADSMTRQAANLSQTADGQRYNDLRYATTDPSKSALLSPVRIIHDALQSLPSTAAMATTVYLTRGAAAKAYAEAITAGFGKSEAAAIATKAAGRVATIAGALGEGAVGGLQQGEQTRQTVLDGPTPTSKVYTAMVKAGVSPEDAKQYVAHEAGVLAGGGAALVDSLTNALEGPILGKIVGGEGGNIASRVVKGFAAEGTQEAVQGAGEQLSQNAAQKLYQNPHQALADGVAENVLASFAVGGVTGGTFGAAAGGEHRVPPPAPLGMREAGALQPNITPEDEASPLPTELIAQGKMTIGASDGTTKANQVLRASGVPDVGTRVTVSHNGKQQHGAVADAWTVNVAGQDSVGVKIKLDDGTMIEEPIDTLRDMGVTIAPVQLPSGLPEQDLANPVVQQFAGQGMEAIAAGKGAEPFSSNADSGENLKAAPNPNANIPLDVVQGLVAQGIPEHVARGAAAGVVAESGGQETVSNPQSGAFGLGQWLGARKQALFNRYGPNPTRAQQIEFLAHELKGGDAGGKSVLSAQNEDEALQRYITDFMRPAKGHETSGDIERGRAALGTKPGTQGDMFGGPQVTGTQMDARSAVEAHAEANQDAEAGDLMDHAHAILASDAAGDQQYVGYHGNGLASALGTSITPEEAPDYARAVLAKYGDTEQGRGVVGPTTKDLPEGYQAFGSHTGTLDIPREQMPQIKAEHRGAMVNFLNARGISHEEVTLPAHALKPSQSEFSPEKVQAAKDYTGGDRAILIDESNHVVDGHHQYVAAHDRGQSVRAIRLDAPVDKIAAELKDMPSAETADGGVSISSASNEAENLNTTVVKDGFKTPQQAGLWIKNQKLPTPRHQVEGTSEGSYRVIDTGPQPLEAFQPMFKAPEGDHAQSAVLRAIHEGRGEALLHGARKWAFDNAYAVGGGKHMRLSPQGATKMAEIEQRTGQSEADREGGEQSAAPEPSKQAAMKAKQKGKKGGETEEARQRREHAERQRAEQNVRHEEFVRGQKARKAELAKTDYRKPDADLGALNKPGDRSMALENYNVDVTDKDQIRAMLDANGIAMTQAHTVYRLEQRDGEWQLREHKESAEHVFGVGRGWSRDEAIDRAVDWPKEVWHIGLADGKSRHSAPFDLRVYEDADGRFFFDSNMSYANGGGSGPTNGSHYFKDRMATLEEAKSRGVNAMWNAWRNHVDNVHDEGERKRDTATWKKIQDVLLKHMPDGKREAGLDKASEQSDLNRDLETYAWYATGEHDVGALQKSALNVDFLNGDEVPEGFQRGMGAPTLNAYQQAVRRDYRRFVERYGEAPQWPEHLDRPDGIDTPPPSGNNAAVATPETAGAAEAGGNTASAKPTGYGASNKVFTAAAADKARATIRDKLKIAERKPVSVIAFVRRLGGIKDNEGHDLSKGRGLRRHPGLINNKTGLSIDAIGEALWEAGYAGTPERRPTESEVLDLLDEADRRPLYPQHQRADAAHQAQDEMEAAREDAARHDVRSLAEEYGLNLNDDEIEAALEYHLGQGMTVDDSIERAVHQSAALDLADVAVASRLEYDYADVADQVFTQPLAEALDGAETSGDGSVDQSRATGPGEASASEPLAVAQTEAQPSAATSGSSEQLDAFGARAGEERVALERQAEGRLRPTQQQKAPGSDGGLFDQRDTTGSIFDRAKPIPSTADEPAVEAQAPFAETAPNDTGNDRSHGGMVALFDEEDTTKQVGWFDPSTGAVEHLGEPAAAATRAVSNPGNETAANPDHIRAASAEPSNIGDTVEITAGDVDRIRARLLQRMDELGIKDRYSLEVANGLKLERDHTRGQIDLYRKIISIALDRSENPDHSLDHEAIHALGPSGLRLITSTEWRVITEAAWADDRLRQWAQTSPAYQHLSEEDQKEEAAAEYFADAVDAMSGRADQGVPLGRVQGFLYRAAYRVGRFFNALRHAVSYLRNGEAGDLRPIDVVLKIDKGVVGKRQPPAATARGHPVTFGKRITALKNATDKLVAEGSLTEQQRGAILAGLDQANAAQQLAGDEGQQANADSSATADIRAEASTKTDRQLTLTPAFKEWFAASKVVDERGRPLIVYHGTSRDQAGEAFTMFDTYASNYGLMGMGGYFTADPAIASAYTKKARGDAPTVYPAYLSIQNPIDMDAQADPEQWMKQFDGAEDFHEGGDTNESWFRAAEEALVAEELPMYEGAEAMQDGLRAMGYDGITHMGGGRVNHEGPRHRVFVAFDPEQIKSAIGNNGEFDPTNPDIRAQAAAPGPMASNLNNDEASARLVGPLRNVLDNVGPKGTSHRLGEAIDNLRYVLQDRMLPVLRVQARVERAIGRTITDEENPYLAEELFHGRTGARLDALMSDHVEPLFNGMKAAGVTTDELETYAYARHAPERNARISKINPEFGSDLLGEKAAGSGMTDEEAASIILAAKESGKADVLEALAKKLERLNDFALQTRVDAGLLSPDEAAMWRNSYEHYVPLRGRPGESDQTAGHMNRSSGFTVRGKEARQAFGRKSRAEDIIPYSIMQAQEAIVRAEQNEVAEALHKLAEAAPDKHFWQINKINRVPVFNKSTGLVSYRNETRIAAEDAPYTVVAKRGGTEYRITFNRDSAAAARVASAIRNLDVQQFRFVVATFGALNRLQSAMITRFAPNFIVTNAFRDLQTAAVNLAGVDLKGIEGRVLKDYPAALVAATKGEFGKGSGDWAKWYGDFKLDGGHVAFNDLSDISTLRNKVDKAVNQARSRLGIRKMLGAALDVVDNMNGGVENALRLATYKNAVQLGATPKQAASLAKNVTVNFNRKGTAGPLINSLYLFFNASVQGNVRIMQAMKSKKVRRILMVSVLLGFLLQLLNRRLSDRDKDGDLLYDKIPEYEKEHNFIFMYPGAKDNPIKIPMPWGYNSFPNMGRMFARMVEGERTTTAISDWLWGVVDAFNPLGGAENIVRTIAPSAFDPVVDLYTNRDYADRPIMPDQKDPGQEVPNSQRYWKSVAPYDKFITDKLNELTGGDNVRPGAIDISPEVLSYLQTTILGGVGTFAKQLLAMGSKAVANDPDSKIEMSDIPFASRVIANKPAWYDKSAFYTRLAQVEQDVTYGRKYIKSGDDAGLIKLVKDEGDVLHLEVAAKAARKAMRRISKERGEVDMALARGRIHQARAHDINRELGAKEDLVINRFNSRYLATVKQPLRP